MSGQRHRPANGFRSGNVPVATPTHAELQRRALEPLIAEPTWHNNEDDDFHHRIIGGHYRFTNDGEHIPRTHRQGNDMSSSMGVSPGSPRNSSYSTSRGSQSSMNSDFYVMVERPSSGILEQDRSMTQSPGTSGGTYACEHGVFTCSLGSNNFIDWDAHRRSHFTGNVPNIIRCPFQCDWFALAEDGQEAWNIRDGHIRASHPLGSAVDHNRRADMVTIDHLWNGYMITDGQRQELASYGDWVRQPGPRCPR